MAKISKYEEQIKTKRKKGIPRLLQIAGTKSVYLFVACILGAIAVVCQISPYVTIYLLVREIVPNIGNLAGLDVAYVSRLGILTLAGIGLYGLLSYAANMLTHVAAFNILYEIRTALAAKLSRMPMGYFNINTNGSIKKVLHEDVERIELFVAHHIIDLVQAVFLPLLSLVILFYFDWRLALATLIPVLLSFLIMLTMYTGANIALYTQWQEKLAAMNGTIVEYVRGMPVVKIFNQTIKAFKRFSDDVYAYRDLTLHWIEESKLSYGGYMALLSSCGVFIIPVAVFLINRSSGEGYADMVSMVFLFLYIGMGIAVPMFKLTTMASYMVQVQTGLSGIDDILEQPEIPDTGDDSDPEGYDLEFQHVSFSYEDVRVLKDISFRVARGTVTALVGPSGGGKTTIANLMGRFWDVDSGEIRIGNRDIRDMAIEKLNDTVSTVFQDVFLFFDTIEENIRMGNDHASFEEVQEAAKAAQIHDFIETLPRGYQTLIGEGGTYLSGGEQQRVALARVILKDAPVVVLDEATAYADPENEAQIQKALSKVLKNKTVITIAHRLYTITEVDQILVVDEGRIVEAGRHADLLEKKGLYHKMWGIHTRARDWNMDMGREETA
ncbi:MAG: multidrug ABC transporter [Bacteroidetes bacterium]|nr:MAG: multidrug ABC transporter [Bacteroidota bacterium]